MARTSAALIADWPLWANVAALPLPVPRSSPATAAALLGAVLMAFIAYGLALRLVWGRPVRTLVVAAPGLLFLSVAALQLPNSNTDIFNYIMRGRVTAVHHQSPYQVPAVQFQDDPLYPYASSRFTETPDGKLPAMELVDAGLARLAGDDPVTNLLVFRLAFLILCGANMFLLFRIARLLAPAWASFAIVCYSWNPVVAYFGPSKTDTLMTFCLLAGIYLLVSGRRRLAIIPLTLSVLVKLITLPLVAIYWLRVLRRSRIVALRDAILGAVVILVTYLPYGLNPDLFFRHASYMGIAASDSVGFLEVRRLVGCAAFAVVVLWAGLRGRERGRDLLYDWGWVLVLFSLFASKLELAWYLFVQIAIVSLATEWRLSVAGFLVALASFTLTLWRTTFSRGFTAPPIPDVAWMWLLLLPLVLGLAILGYGGARIVIARRNKRGAECALLE